MSNYEWITGMGPGELAAFLELTESGECPWHAAFDRNFCRSCPAETVRLEGIAEPVEVYPCDYAGHQCPNGDPLPWWLRQEVQA